MTARVASIYFAPVLCEREGYGGHYEIPAVGLHDKPFILEVTDKIQRYRGPYTLGGGTKRSEHRETILGEKIADDIVRHWTQMGVFMTPACHPGIWVVRDRIAETNEDGTLKIDADNKQVFRDATKEEAAAMWAEDLAANRAADQAYAKALFEDGNTYANDPRGSRAQFIQKPARLGAQQYGYEADWVSGLPIEVKTCQFCTKKIPKRAIVCPFCREIVDATAYGIEHAKRDREVKKALQEAKQAA